MTPHPPAASRPRARTWRLWLGVLALAAVFTLLQTTQEAVRGATPRSDLLRSLGFNALDWFAWGPFVALIIAIGPRWRVGATRGWWRNAARWIALGVTSCVGVAIITGLVVAHWHLLPPPAPVDDLPRFLPRWVLSTAPFNTLVFFALTALLHAVVAYDELRERQIREAELQARASRAELSVLRMQLQPHFVFNALHTVSSLMMTDVAAAQQVIASLGVLLRASIDHTAREEVPLRDELEFVERYVDIQRARFRQRLGVHVDVDDDLVGAMVPSLILQPLVENAIRHGVEHATAGGDIWIGATRRGDDLWLHVRDAVRDGDAPRAAAPRDPASGRAGGVGLANIEARLAQLYGPRQAFRAGPDAEGRFEVAMRLPYRVAP